MLFSIIDSVLEIFGGSADGPHTFYTADRTTPVKGVVTAVGPRKIVVRTRKGKEVEIARGTLSKKDRAYVDLWLQRHPLPRIVEALPDIKLAVKKRIDPTRSPDTAGAPKLKLFFDVTIENLTDSRLPEISIAYTLFNEHTQVTRWEAVSRGEITCALEPKAHQTHIVEGSMRNPDGKYDSNIHRILVYGLIAGKVVVQASDSPELLRHVSLQNATLAG